MPKERITKERSKVLARKVSKVFMKKRGMTNMLEDTGLYPNTLYNALRGKTIQVDAAEKIEKYLDDNKIK